MLEHSKATSSDQSGEENRVACIDKAATSSCDFSTRISPPRSNPNLRKKRTRSTPPAPASGWKLAGTLSRTSLKKCCRKVQIRAAWAAVATVDGK